MNSAFRAMAVVVAAGLALPALAQDSVSKAQGPVGDAVSPWNAGEQINSYIVDLTPFTTSKGTPFGIGPIIKQSKTGTANFSSLPSGNAASSFTRIGAPWAATSYMLWTGPGQGVNNDSALNDPGTLVSPSGHTRQVGVAFAEFATSDSLANINNVIAGVVQYRAENPGRLYVKRVMAAANSLDGTTNLSQFGLGGVDSSGNVAFRADHGQSTPNSLFRVAASNRSGAVVNVITANAAPVSGTDATTTVLDYSPTTHNTPALIDAVRAAAAGGTMRPSVIATNFDANYRYEVTPGVMTPGDTAHRPGTGNHRGNVHYSHRQLLAGTAGTGAMITRPTGGTNKNISVWGVDPVGLPVNARTLTVDPTIPDNHPAEAFTLGIDGFIQDIIFNHYQSSTAFRGSNGPVAIGRDAQGRTLIACHVGEASFSSDDPEGAIVVARYDASNPLSTVEWTVAAWNIFNGGFGADQGKQVYNGAGDVIGELSTLYAVTNGTVLGPSISAPAFDAAGNIWFIGTMQTYNAPDPDGFNTALFRAVYDPTTFSYEIENVLKAGFVFSGQNSGRDYQIRFLNLNAGPSGSASASPAGVWSGSIVQTGLAGAPTGAYAPADPRNLGGIVVMAEIVYDVDQDEQFNKVTGANGTPGSLDQEYNVMLYIGAMEPGCSADVNFDGQVNGVDLGLLLGAWASSNPVFDLNGDGTVNGVDLGLLLGQWGTCN